MSRGALNSFFILRLISRIADDLDDIKTGIPADVHYILTDKALLFIKALIDAWYQYASPTEVSGNA